MDVDCVIIPLNDDGFFPFHITNVDCIVVPFHDNRRGCILTSFQAPVLFQLGFTRLVY